MTIYNVMGLRGNFSGGGPVGKGGRVFAWCRAFGVAGVVAATGRSTTREGVALISITGVRPDGCGPHGHFSRANLSRLTRDVGRRNMLRPVAIHPVTSASHCRVIFNRHECHTSIVTNLRRIPTVVSRLSSRRTRRVTIARGLRHGSIAPARRTGTCGRLVSDKERAMRALSILFNGDRGCVHAQLGFSALVPRLTRLLSTSIVAVDITSRVYQCKRSIRHRICRGCLGRNVRRCSD